MVNVRARAHAEHIIKELESLFANVKDMTLLKARQRMFEVLIRELSNLEEPTGSVPKPSDLNQQR